MAINDLPSPKENKTTLFLSLKLKKALTNNTMDKSKYSNNDDKVSKMERFSMNHASSSSFIPTTNDHMPDNSIKISNYNSTSTENTNLLELNCDDEVRNSVSDTIGSKEEVDLIELLGRDWPDQAGDSLTNILNSDYNYNKDTISKQDLKKYEYNNRLKHTQIRYSLNSERNKSINPVSHLISDRKYSETRNLNSKLKHSTVTNKCNDSTSSLRTNEIPEPVIVKATGTANIML